MADSSCKRSQWNLHIRQPTFYKHFNDKYDFVKFVIHTIQKDTFQAIETDTDTETLLDYFLTCFEKVLQLIESYQKILLHFKIRSIDEFRFEIANNYLEM